MCGWPNDAAESSPGPSVWSRPQVTMRPPPHERNHDQSSCSMNHGATIPGDACHAMGTPASSQRPMSKDRSTSTSKVSGPLRNSSTRTPRPAPSPSVTRRTPPTWSSLPTRRSSSGRVSDRPNSVGMPPAWSVRRRRAGTGGRASGRWRGPSRTRPRNGPAASYPGSRTRWCRRFAHPWSRESPPTRSVT